MLWLQTNKEGSGSMNLSGSLTRQVSDNMYHIIIYYNVNMYVNTCQWQFFTFFVFFCHQIGKILV